MPVVPVEFWLIVGLAFLFGLLLGWLIWGRALGRNQRIAFELAQAQTAAGDASSNRVRLERELAAARDQIAPLADEVDRLRRDLARAQRTAPAKIAQDAPRPVEVVPLRPAPTPVAEPVHERVVDRAPQPAPNMNDLRLLKGVGDKMESQLRLAGVPDIATLAALTPDSAARVDGWLGPFAGRIARDQLIDQARLLAAGRVTEYEARYGRLDRA